MQSYLPASTGASLEESHPQPAPLACDLSAIDEANREAHLALAADLLWRAAEERRDLPDGYAFRFPADEYRRVVDFIALERLCCAFFHFVLDVAPAAGPLWLSITGPAEVKTFLQSTLAQPAP